MLALRFTPDGTGLWTGSTKGALRLLDVRTKAVVRETTSAGAGVVGFDLSRDGRLVAVGDRKGVVRIYDSTTLARPARALALSDKTMYAVAFHPTRPLVATGGVDGTIRIVRWKTGRIVARTEPLGETVYTLAWHRKGALLASGAGDGKVRLHRLAARTPATVAPRAPPR